MGDRRYQQSSAVLERDEASVEEMIDRRCEHQSVASRKPLRIRAIAPRLDVTRAQMLGTIDVRDSASMFELENTLAEPSLAAAREDKRNLLGWTECGIFLDLATKVLFPNSDLGHRRRCGRLRDQLTSRDGAELVPD